MRKLVAIGLAMHGVREALSVTGLIHRRPGTTSRHARNAAETADAANASLLDRTGLRADHGHTAV